MAWGTVIQWNGQTGFFTDAADNARVFFGDRALRGLTATEIHVGLELEFDRVQADRGPAARNVRRRGAASPPQQTPASPGRHAKPSPRPRDPFRPPVFQLHAPMDHTLPPLTRRVVADVRTSDRHPVMQLDRYSIPGDQQTQREALEKVVSAARESGLLADVFQRRVHQFSQLAPPDCRKEWCQTTAGPLTLHLSRANALENAGLCLHPLYGFAYLPGTGLKGMARAAAETMLELSRDRIVQIFGNEAGEPDPELQRCGAVCFHDAWPTKWPALIVDIVNSHHAKYYGGGDDDTPGDWESPVPVNFLAVATGTEYSFCLTARRADTDPGLVNDAAECLRCALSGSGAGAKTAAGYGWFLPAPVVATSRVPSRNARWNRSYRLRLESSAFLAGARQEQQDCDLRSATLRGQLRSWWRTLHSGFLKNQQLRQLEGALWGNTTQGAAIRIHLVRSRSQSEPRLHAHPAQGSGLRYLAYGMDEKSHGVRRQRWKLEAGAEWELHVSISASRYFSRPPKPDEDRRKLDQTPLTQEQVVSHFESALWLLTHYGGVGSKGRKGFGSLRVVSENPWRSPLTLDSVRATAASLRQDLNLPNAFTESLAESAALSHPGVVLKEIEVTVRSGDAAIEQAGNAYMKTAGSVGHKHNPDKQSLGLPRKIHGPGIKPLPHQNSVTHLPPLFLDTPRRDPLHQRREEDARYASPVHLHVTEVTTGRWLVRLLAFPAAFLPDHAQSAAYLKKFSDSFAATLEVAASSGGSGLGGHRESGPAHPEPRRAASGYKLVEVKVLEIKTLNDKPSLRVQESGRKPGMLNTGVPPASLPAEGDTITVYWSTTSNPASPTYRWDLPEPPTQGKSGTSKKKS